MAPPPPPRASTDRARTPAREGDPRSHRRRLRLRGAQRPSGRRRRVRRAVRYHRRRGPLRGERRRWPRARAFAWSSPPASTSPAFASCRPARRRQRRSPSSAASSPRAWAASTRRWSSHPAEGEDATRHTVSQSELTTVPGTFGDPLRVIQNLPGVARSPYGLGLLIIRGSSPQDSGVYVDGHRVPLLYHFLGGPSVLTPDLIDRIDFYPGRLRRALRPRHRGRRRRRPPATSRSKRGARLGGRRSPRLVRLRGGAARRGNLGRGRRAPLVRRRAVAAGAFPEREGSTARRW